MNSTTTQIDVSSCYRIDRYFENMSTTKSLQVMHSDRACLYDSASRQENTSVTLTRCNLICPYCNHIHPLKTHKKITPEHIDIIEQWANPQLTLSPSQNRVTFFPTSIATFTCPICGYSSNNQENLTTITTTCQKNKVHICCEVTDVFRILSLPYLPKSMFHIEFPLYEQIEFHLGKGRICIRIVSGNNQTLRTVDITNNPQTLSGCVLADWFYKIDTLRNIILEAFQTATQAGLPFDAQNITLEDLLFFTRFIGYSKAFYDAIPYEKETFIIDGSFKHLQRLHTQKSAIAYLRSFSFAKFKSIRKQIFEKSELLFYLPECELLFNAIGDVNVFRTILQSEYALEMLLTLHEYPVLIDFLRDFCKVKGVANIYRMILSRGRCWHTFRDYMFRYCSLSQYGKSKEQKKWKHKNDYMDTFQTHSYSLPITRPAPKEAARLINGFMFKPLRNTAECFKIGKDLKNCLCLWESFNSAIVAVTNDSETVAAIAIWGNSISQAHSYNNSCVKSVPGLAEAIAEWAKQNELIVDIDPDVFIEFVENE